ncbi:MAG: DNA polymerase III subunit beta [Proteobacteria bacterium]|nr:DNA polymerase III subunit beta [Pseudomonadota bacterium]
MELTVQKSSFLKALAHGQSIVEKRTTVPVLSHVLLSATQAGLTLTSTDLDLSLVETIQAQVRIAGRICVPAHLLYDIIKKLPDLPINLQINQETQQLNIKAGRSDFNLPGLSPDDFPEITSSPLSHHFNIGTKDLGYMIDHTKFAMSDDEVRHHLNGIYFHLFEENGLKMRAVASDLHRLACVSINAPDGLTDMPYTIVGRKAILEIRKLLDESLETVKIGLSDRRFELSLQSNKNTISFSTRLVDGLFPEYQHAIEASVERSVKVNTRSLADAADRVSTVITGHDKILRINLEGQQAKLSAVSQQLGAAQEEIDVTSTCNDPMQICFNVNYLLDVAGLIKDEEMFLDITSVDTPTIIRPANSNSNDQIYAIMHLTA